MAIGKLSIPFLIGFISLTRPSFNSFCMFVTGLNSFEVRIVCSSDLHVQREHFVGCSTLS